MSLKAIEMQVIIPRTTEAGALQNQLSHKPGQDQASLAAMMARRMEEKRHKSDKVDDTSDMLVRDEDSSSKSREEHSHRNAKGEKTAEEGLHSNVHPYKGHHIDLTM